jgi:perosamine synthetase
VKIRRTQPPVGYRFPAIDLVRAGYRTILHRDDSLETFWGELASVFQTRRVYGVSSGKAALAIVLRGLHRRTGRTKVILPAYTCYSVPSAILKAGLDPVPCDLDVGGFDYDYGQLKRMLGPDVLCVLSVHLFGVPADSRLLVELCRPHGIFTIEDAAQAMGGQSRGAHLGTVGDVGVFSLGRGKNLPAAGGGIILANSEAAEQAIDAVIERVPGADPSSDVRSFSTLLMTSVLLSPSMYWLPAALPFLHLGETLFHEDFPVRGFSRFEVNLLRGWVSRLQQLNAIRRSAAVYYIQNIDRARDCATEIPYLRFPVVLETPEMKAQITNEQGRRLGISGMYPDTVAGIPQLQGRFAGRSFPRATRLVRSLVTLPTHPLLEPRDLKMICSMLNDVSSRCSEGFRGQIRAQAAPVDRPI